MRRLFGLFATLLLLAACALPSSPQPSPEPVAPTAPRTEDTPTTAPIAAATAAVPTGAPAATAAAEATSAPANADILDDPNRIAQSPPIARDQLALAEAFKGIGDVP